MTTHKVLCISLATIGILCCHATRAESWNYQSYNRNGPAAPGYLTLDAKDGESRIKIVAPGLGTCYETDLNASVERTDQTIVITVAPRFPSCEEIRFVIKTDGTGGTRQVKRGEAWVNDRTERVLTIRN